MNLGLSLSLGAAARGEVGPPAPVTIGGIAVGAAGTETFNTGYVLSGGDDFNGALSIAGPVTPRGKYGTTRGSYLINAAGQHPRGSPMLAGYDVDPQHTGFLDRNRGVVPASYADMMVQGGGEITLRHRTATAAEKLLMTVQTKQALAAMIHTGLAFLGRAPVIFEWRETRQNTVKSHFTGWVMQANGYACDNDIELDFEAASSIDGGGDGRGIQYNTNGWTNGALTSQTSDPGPTLVNGQYYRYALRIDETGTATFWLDGALVKTFTGEQAKAIARPFYALFTAHAYENANWGDSPDATYTVDWFRVWRKPENPHYEPLIEGGTYNVDYGTAGSFVLPTQAQVWGATVTETVESCMTDANEPGGSSNGDIYAALPTGITYTAGTRTLAVGSNVAKPGLLQIVRYVNAPGVTCVPQRIILNVGPNITVNTIEYEVGEPFSFDLYAACDCGMLVINGSGPAKTVSVTGLPAWATYSSATGLITGTPTGTGTVALNVSVTNSVGQTASKAVSLIEATAPVTSFTDNFTGTNGQFLEDRTGWTLQTGTAGAARINSTNELSALHNSTLGTSYLSPDLGSANHYAQFNFLNSATGPSVALRLSDINNWVAVRLNGTIMRVILRVAGSTNTQAEYNVTGIVGTDVIRFEVVGSTFAVFRNGTKLIPTTGTETVGALPSSTRQGLVLRIDSQGRWIDNYTAGLV